MSSLQLTDPRGIEDYLETNNRIEATLIYHRAAMAR
jgi:hypothetical protein